MNIFNETFVAQFPLISILLGFLSIWMITFLILAFRSSSSHLQEQEEEILTKAPAARKSLIQPTMHGETVSHRRKEAEVAQVAGLRN